MRVNYKCKNAVTQIAKEIRPYLKGDVIIVCIGTDKCIGDCLGPLIGTFLQSSTTLRVFGTLEEPIHALNIKEFIRNINLTHPNSKIIAIDACLSDSNDVGNILIRQKPIRPGKGVGKDLPSIGDISIAGIVSTNNEGIYTDKIRLGFIHEMASVITDGIILTNKNRYRLFRRSVAIDEV